MHQEFATARFRNVDSVQDQRNNSYFMGGFCVLTDKERAMR